MFEHRYFPGDPVVNIFPHRAPDGFLINLNELGVVEEVHEETKSVTISWSRGVSTTVNVSAVTLPSSVLRSIR